MKLINNRYQQHIDFDNCFAYFLIIENSKEYLKVVEELYNECFSNLESEFVLSENDKIVDISKKCLLLHNFFDLDLNNKKIINEINSRVENVFSENDFVEDFYKLNKLFIDINDKIVDCFDFNLEYDADLTYEKLIKLSSYKLATQTNFAERLMSYIKIYSSLKKAQIIIFVGLSEYLSQKELTSFLKQLEYLDLKCLLIEPYQKYKLDFVEKIIIDEDLCEI